MKADSIARDLLVKARALHAQMQTIKQRRNRDKIELAWLLLEMQEGDLAEALGYANVGAYAERELEQSPSETRQLVSLAKKMRENTELEAAAESGEIGWTKLSVVANVSIDETMGER